MFPFFRLVFVTVFTLPLFAQCVGNGCPAQGTANGGTGTNTTFTQGNIIFAGVNGVYSNDSALLWNAIDHCAAIGSGNSGCTAAVAGSALFFRNTNGPVSVFQNTNAGLLFKINVNNVTGAVSLQNRNTADSANLPIEMNPTGGRVLIGGTTDSGAILNVTGSISGSTSISGATHLTATNCTSSAAPAVCASAAAGSVVVAAAGTTVTVNTTAVTANSQIFVMYDSSLGTKLSVTCNVTEPALYGVTARSAGTSFTLTSSAPITNPACFSYFIVN